MKILGICLALVCAAAATWCVEENRHYRAYYRHLLRDYDRQMKFGLVGICEEDPIFAETAKETRTAEQQILEEAKGEIEKLFPRYDHVDITLSTFWHYEKGSVETRCKEMIRRGFAPHG